jgi:Fungal rhodopsin domain
MFYTGQIIYVAVQVFAKTSILLLYLRVFTRRWFTIACNVGIAFLALHGIAFIFAVSFQCKPVESIWNPRITGKCISLTAVGISGAILSIVEDFVILILPIPEIINLQMGTNKKWALVLLFGIGSLLVPISATISFWKPVLTKLSACITSGIRLKYFMKFGASFDPTCKSILNPVYLTLTK